VSEIDNYRQKWSHDCSEKEKFEKLMLRIYISVIEHGSLAKTPGEKLPNNQKTEG
jgi:hypothetical protein